MKVTWQDNFFVQKVYAMIQARLQDTREESPLSFTLMQVVTVSHSMAGSLTSWSDRTDWLIVGLKGKL